MRGQGFAKRAPALGNPAQFSHNMAGSFLVARILDDPKLPLHAEPLHCSRLVLPVKALTIGTFVHQIRFEIQIRTPLSSYA